MKLVKVITGLAMLVGFSAQAQEFEKRVRINGYSSFEYEYMFSDEGDGDPNGSFDADLIDLVFNVDLASNLRFATDLTWEHGAASEDGRGNVAVEYAFPEYTIKDWLKVRAGKMFVPFGIYNEIHTAKPAFLAVKEPLSTNKPDKVGADMRFYPRWATGISVLGNFFIQSFEFEYHVQLSNGEQENTNPFEEDDNKQKALATRLLIRPVPNITIGVSSYSDKLTELDDNGDDTGRRTEVFSIGAHSEFTFGNFGGEIEYVHGKVDHSVNGSVKKSAIELMAYYTLKERFTPYVRWEQINPDNNVSDNGVQTISLGLNTRIVKQYFLKMQYNSVNSSVNNDDLAGVDFTEFQAAIVLGF